MLARPAMLAQCGFQLFVALAGIFNSQLLVLQALLKNARETHNTFSEVAWLQAQSGKVNNKLCKG